MQPLPSPDLIVWGGREQGASQSSTFSFTLGITPLNRLLSKTSISKTRIWSKMFLVLVFREEVKSLSVVKDDFHTFGRLLPKVLRP